MNPVVERLRTGLHRAHELTGARYWFPHIPLALMLALGGIWFLASELGGSWHRYFQDMLGGSISLPPRELPPLLIGGGVITMAVGLTLRSRVAWNMALLLAAAAVVSVWLTGHRGFGLLFYFVLVLTALILSWRYFDRASVTASTLFALTSVVMLILYATFGSYYLGAYFKPQITDIITAFYYSMVTMSTVGYGDISPQTAEAKLFAVSIIILGVAVFATSLTAIIAPLVSNSLSRVINRREKAMVRRNHFIVLGNTALAVNTWRELTKRGRNVTRIVRDASLVSGQDKGDVVVGDPGSAEALTEAGAQDATAVIAMLDDDSDNAFAILAVRELGGRARTVVAVNDASHMSRIKLVQPDVVIAPQVLGGELLAMMLSGEEVTPEFVMTRVFHQNIAAS